MVCVHVCVCMDMYQVYLHSSYSAREINTKTIMHAYLIWVVAVIAMMVNSIMLRNSTSQLDCPDYNRRQPPMHGYSYIANQWTPFIEYSITSFYHNAMQWYIAISIRAIMYVTHACMQPIKLQNTQHYLSFILTHYSYTQWTHQLAIWLYNIAS